MKFTLVAAVLLSACSSAGAQSFPAKPIRIIVPFSAGGSIDPLARILGVSITESVGQQVLVENRPGASSIIGMVACAKSAPDGHTLCLTTADSLSFNPALFSELPYNPDTDFGPVINLGWSHGSLVANAKAPFNSFKEMIAYAKAKPRALNWGTWGPASRPDVYLQWINRREGVEIAAIAYKGAGQGNPAVLSGEVDITFMGIGLASQHIKAGKLKPLVTLGEARSSFMPGVPTLAEESEDPRLVSYFGVFAPGRTPRAIIDRLNAEFARAIRSPKTLEYYRANTLEPFENTPAEFASFTRRDRENASKVFRSIGIQPSAAPVS